MSPLGQSRSLLDADSDGRVVAYSSALPPDVDADLVVRQRRVARQLRAAARADLVDYIDSPFFSAIAEHEKVPGVDLDDAREIAMVNDRLARSGGCRCTIIGYPADTAPDLPYSMGF